MGLWTSLSDIYEDFQKVEGLSFLRKMVINEALLNVIIVCERVIYARSIFHGKMSILISMVKCLYKLSILSVLFTLINYKDV